MQIDKAIPPGTYPVNLQQNALSEIVAVIMEGEHQGEKITLIPDKPSKIVDLKTHKQRKFRHKSKRNQNK